MSGFMNAANLGFQLWNAISQRRAEFQATRANEARYRQGLEAIGGDPSDQQRLLERLSPDLLFRSYQGDPAAMQALALMGGTPLQEYGSGFYGQQRGDIEAVNRGMAGRVGELRARSEERYRGYGQQARADIERGFAETKASAEQDLLTAGMSRTTVMPTVRAGIERERGAAQARFGEQLTGLMQDLDERLTGQEMSVYETGMNRRLGLRQEQLDRFLNWVGGRQDAYPSQSGYLNTAAMLGQGAAPAASYPGADWLGPAVQGTATVASSAILAKAIMMRCISGTARIITSNANRPLSDIQIGEEVWTPFGWRRVLEKDYGVRPGKWRFLLIEIGRFSIVLTDDHWLRGRPAGDYAAGDWLDTLAGQLQIRAIHESPPVACGDLRVEGDVAYYANSIVVDSMFSSVPPPVSEPEDAPSRTSGVDWMDPVTES